MKSKAAIVVLASSAVVMTLYGLFGFLVVPGFIERQLPIHAARYLEGSFAVGSVQVNPFTLRVALDDLQVSDSKGASILTAKRLLADLSWSSLLRRTWIFSRIHLERPQLNAARTDTGQLNLVSLLRKRGANGSGAQVPRLIIRALTLAHGAVRLVDPGLAELGMAQDLTLEPVDLTLSNLSTLGNKTGTYSAQAALPGGASLAWEGNLALTPLASQGRLNIQNLPAASIWKLLRARLAITAPEGRFDMRAAYRFSWQERAFQIDQAHVEATGLTFARQEDPTTPILQSANIVAQGATLDYQRREMVFPVIAARGGSVTVVIAPDGTINWRGLLRRPKTAQGAAPRPWSIRLTAASIENVSVNYAEANREKSLSASTTLTAIKLSVAATLGAGAFRVVLEDVVGKLADFKLFEAQTHASLLKAATASVVGGRLDSAQRWMAADTLVLNDGGSMLGRDEARRIMVAGLTRADRAIRPVMSGGGNTGRFVVKPPWRFALGSVALNRFDLVLLDRGVKPAIRYDTHVVSAQVTNLGRGLAQAKAFEAVLHRGRNTRINFRGQVGQDGTEGTVQFENFSLAPLYPMITRYVGLDVRAGPVTAAFSFSYATARSDAARTARNKRNALRLNNFSARATDVSVSQRNSKVGLLRLDAIAVQGGEFASDEKRIAARTLTLSGGGAMVTRARDGHIPLFDVLRRREAKGPALRNASKGRTESDSAPWRWSMGVVALNQFALKVADQTFQPEIAYDTYVQSLRVSHVDSTSKRPMTIQALLQVDRTGRLGANGTLSQDGKNAQGSITATNISLTPLAPLMHRYSKLKLDTGPLFAASDFVYRAGTGSSASSRGAGFRLENVSAHVTALTVSSPGMVTPLVQIDSVALEGGKLDSQARRIGADTLTLRGGSTRLVRSAAGELALFDVLRAGGAKSFAPDAKNPRPQGEKRWRYWLKKLALESFDLKLEDRGFDPAVVLGFDIRHARLTDIDRQSLRPAGITALIQVGQQGQITANGTLTQAWDVAQAKFQISGFALEALAPVLRRFANLDLRAGQLGATGSARYRRGSTLPSFEAHGEMTATDVLVNIAGSQQRFMSWRALVVKRVRFARSGDARTSLEVDDILVDAPSAALEIAQDSTLNVKEIVPDKSSQPVSSAGRRSARTSGARLAIRLNRLRIANGTLEYRDDSLVLPFSTRIEALNGALVNVSNASGARARVSAEGRIGRYGFAHITGDIAIFRPALFTDIRARFDNVLMEPLSPYSATFAGRRIDSGKIWLDVRYRIYDKALSGTNEVRLENFKLGEKVATARASNVPWDLVVATLKDAQGSLEVSVPITGNVGDPRFNYRVLIGQAIGNLAQRILSAPFRWAGRLPGVGRGPRVEVIEFEPGRIRLLPPEQEKLNRVASALRSNPRLQLKVPTPYDSDQDAVALAEQRVRSQLAGKLGERFMPGLALEPLALGSTGTRLALAQLLSEHSSKVNGGVLEPVLAQGANGKEEQLNGMIPPPQGRADDMAFYASLFRELTQINLPALQDLRRLGERRAQVIRDYLVRTGNIDSQRIEILPVRVSSREREASLGARLRLSSSTGNS